MTSRLFGLSLFFGIFLNLSNSLAAAPSAVSIPLFKAGELNVGSSYGSVPSIPAFVHYGFVEFPGGPWTDVADVAIQYEQGLQNRAVDLKLMPTGDSRTRLVAFQLAYQPIGIAGSPTWGEIGYLDPAHPAGHWVRLPIDANAGYPFSCFEIAVSNLTANGSITGAGDGVVSDRFAGRATQTMYGFTQATRLEYVRDRNVAWQNIIGEPTRQLPDLPAAYAHNGQYKGLIAMAPVHVRVPDGLNLVFKIRFDRMSARGDGFGCQTSGESAETQLTSSRSLLEIGTVRFWAVYKPYFARSCARRALSEARLLQV